MIAAEHTIELLAQHLNQDVSAAGRIDLEQGVQLGTEAPGPQRLAPILVAGFIDVDGVFPRQRLQQFLIRTTGQNLLRTLSYV